jgi:hypothetical protein
MTTLSSSYSSLGRVASRNKPVVQKLFDLLHHENDLTAYPGAVLAWRSLRGHWKQVSTPLEIHFVHVRHV